MTYEQPPQQPQPQQQQPIYVQGPPTSGNAVASLIFGIAGLFLGCCTFGIPSIIAVILGHAALGETKTGARGGHGMAIAGLILGYVLVIPMIFFSFWFIVGGGMSSIDSP